jgi:hypothetical protein
MATAFSDVGPLGAALLLALSMSACAGDRSELFGRYRVQGEAQDATLELTEPNRYRFCQGERCAVGEFSFGADLGGGAGRITFKGPEFERYTLALHERLYGPSEVQRQRGIQGAIEMNYSVDSFGAQIHVEPGSDTAFVKS